MTKFSKRYGTALSIIAIVVFMVGGMVIASNMGFKLSFGLLKAAGTNSGTNWVSLPMYFPFANALDWKADITNCTQVTRFVRSNDTLQTYTGAKGSINFPIEKGTAYLVKVSADTSYVVVGAHDPSYAVPLLKAVGTNSGTNWVSVPYHSTTNNALELKADIANCTQVTKFVRSNDTLQT